MGATPELGASRAAGVRRTVVNAVAVLGGETVSRLAGWLMAFVVAHRFGASGLGQYAYAVALSSVLLMIPDFGFHLAAIRDLSAKPNQLRQVFWTLHWIKLPLVGALVCGVLVFGSAGLHDQGRRTLLYVLVARAALITFSQAYMAIFKAFERMHYIGLVQSVNAALVAAAIAIAWYFQANLTLTVACLVVGQIVETAAGWYTARRRFPTGDVYGWDGELVKTLLAAAAPIGVTVVLQALNLRLDLLILSVFASNAELGRLQAASSFLLATFLGTSLALGVIFPRMCRLMSQGGEEGGLYVGSLLKHGTLLVAVLSLAVWLAAPQLLRVLYGRELMSATSLLRVLVPALPFTFINTVLVYVFFAAGLRSVYLNALALSVVLTGILCVWLVPRYGATGAVVADLIRESAVSAMLLLNLKRRGLATRTARALLTLCSGAAILTLLLLEFVPSHGHSPLWTAFCPGLLLGGLLLLAGLPKRAEIMVVLGGRR